MTLIATTSAPTITPTVPPSAQPGAERVSSPTPLSLGHLPDSGRQRAVAQGHLGLFDAQQRLVGIAVTDQMVFTTLIEKAGPPKITHSRVVNLPGDQARRILVEPQHGGAVFLASRRKNDASPVTLARVLEAHQIGSADAALREADEHDDEDDDLFAFEEDKDGLLIAPLRGEGSVGAEASTRPLNAPTTADPADAPPRVPEVPMAWPLETLLLVVDQIHQVFCLHQDLDLFALLNELRRQGRRADQDAATRFAQRCVWPEEVVDALPAGTVLATRLQGLQALVRVERVRVTEGMRGPLLAIHLVALGVGREGGLAIYRRTQSMAWWKGAQSLEELGLVQATAAQCEAATAAGRLLQDLSSGALYRSTERTFLVKQGWRLREMQPGPRVVLDPVGLGLSDPATFDDLFQSLGFDRRDSRHGDDDENSVHRAAHHDAASVAGQVLGIGQAEPDWAVAIPFQPAWGLKARTWGMVPLEGSQPVQPCSRAYDRLVLAPGRKELVLALIEHGPHGFSDIIDGKSGGCVFLLEGSPGTGKTLTAEAAAERLGRPLYMVAVGELGTEPGELESRLTEILGLAARWQAVVLLDEADIFLERRRSGDVHQNALVSIFLRQLEYYSGVLFLTSNRAADLDPALASRLALRLPFPTLTTAQRADIWRSLLGAAGASVPEIAPGWAERPMNGRTIKNAIRLAAALARAEGREGVDAAAIERVLALLDQLDAEVAAHDTAGGTGQPLVPE